VREQKNTNVKSINTSGKSEPRQELAPSRPSKTDAGPLEVPWEKTNPQDQSLLFAKLPIELRLRIWELVLDGNEIKISYRYYPKRPVNWWSISKTCLRAYSESIDILYSQTRFHLIEAYYLTRIKSLIPPQRFLKIRYIYLNIEFEPVMEEMGMENGIYGEYFWTGEVYGVGKWPAICETLESLPNLRELRLTISDETKWLKPARVLMLKNVRVEEVFEIRFLYPVDKDLRDVAIRDVALQGVKWRFKDRRTPTV
jgi:hypothetical protein